MSTTQHVDGDVPWPEDAVEIGRISGGWGLKGWFKVQAFASDPQALFSTKRWYLMEPPPRGAVQVVKPARTVHTLLKIAEVREHADGIVARAHDVDDRDGADALVGARIHIPRASFPTAAEDEYYWVDLIGLTVLNRDGHELGRVVGLIDTGPHSVLRVAAEGVTDEASETLIPFVAAYVDGVSLAERRITVDWGLDY